MWHRSVTNIKGERSGMEMNLQEVGSTGFVEGGSINFDVIFLLGLCNICCFFTTEVKSAGINP